jgi:hypothetical protein
LRVCCRPVRRQRGWRHAIEVFGICAKGTRRTLQGSWRNSGQNVNPAPASDIVWWTRRSAQLVGDEVSCVIQSCPTSGNVVTQIWPRTPEQCHGASDVRGRHGRATESRIRTIGSVITGTRACAWRGDIRFGPVTAIDRHRTAAAKVSNHILACGQRTDGVRCCVNGGRIHDSGTIGTVVACACHHHDAGSSLGFNGSLQRVSRTTFRWRANP